MVCVDALNYFLEHTFCRDELLACCDPLNHSGPFEGIPYRLGPNGWLMGHLLAYAFAGYTYGRCSHIAHANLLLCQLAWFLFEYVTYQHTYAWEQLVLYDNGTHPCAERAYYSTWIPIWQDFPYNMLGQLLGGCLYRFRHRAQTGSKGGADADSAQTQAVDEELSSSSSSSSEEDARRRRDERSEQA